MPPNQSIELEWKGPLKIGSLPTEAEECEALRKPGIYLFIGSYLNDIMSAYAGLSTSVFTRYQEHLRWWLGGGYSIRDMNGEHLPITDQERQRWFNEWDKFGRLAYEDVSRQKFFYSICNDSSREFLHSLEARLIEKLHQWAQTSEKHIIENSRRGTFYDSFEHMEVKNNLSAVPELKKILPHSL